MAVDMYMKITPAKADVLKAESQDSVLKGDDGWFQVTQGLDGEPSGNRPCG